MLWAVQGWSWAPGALRAVGVKAKPLLWPAHHFTTQDAGHMAPIRPASARRDAEASTSSLGPALPCSQEQCRQEAPGVVCTHTHAWGTNMQCAQSRVATRAPCEAPVCTKPSMPPTPSHGSHTRQDRVCKSTRASRAGQLPAGGVLSMSSLTCARASGKSSLPRGRARPGGLGVAHGGPTRSACPGAG